MKNFIENQQTTEETTNGYEFRTAYEIFVKQNETNNIDPVPDMNTEIDAFWDSKNEGLLTKIMSLIAALILTTGCIAFCYNKSKHPTEKPMTVITQLHDTPNFKGVEYTAALKTAIATGAVNMSEYNLRTTTSSTGSSASVLGNDAKVYVTEVKYVEYSKEEAERLFKHPENYTGYWNYVLDYKS